MGKKTDRMRNAAQSDFDRNRDLFFNLLCGTAGEESDDLNLRVGYVWKCLDRQRPESRDPAGYEKRCQQDEKERLIQSKCDKAFDHGFISYRFRCSVAERRLL